MATDTDKPNEKPAAKQPYEKPKIQVHGRVEDITLKEFGYSDAFLFRGQSPGGGGGSGSLNAS